MTSTSVYLRSVAAPDSGPALPGADDAVAADAFPARSAVTARPLPCFLLPLLLLLPPSGLGGEDRPEEKGGRGGKETPALLRPTAKAAVSASAQWYRSVHCRSGSLLEEDEEEEDLRLGVAEPPALFAPPPPFAAAATALPAGGCHIPPPPAAVLPPPLTLLLPLPPLLRPPLLTLLVAVFTLGGGCFTTDFFFLLLFAEDAEDEVGAMSPLPDFVFDAGLDFCESVDDDLPAVEPPPARELLRWLAPLGPFPPAAAPAAPRFRLPPTVAAAPPLPPPPEADEAAAAAGEDLRFAVVAGGVALFFLDGLEAAPVEDSDGDGNPDNTLCFLRDGLATTTSPEPTAPLEDGDGKNAGIIAAAGAVRDAEEDLDDFLRPPPPAVMLSVPRAPPPPSRLALLGDANDPDDEDGVSAPAHRRGVPAIPDAAAPRRGDVRPLEIPAAPPTGPAAAATAATDDEKRVFLVRNVLPPTTNAAAPAPAAPPPEVSRFLFEGKRAECLVSPLPAAAVVAVASAPSPAAAAPPAALLRPRVMGRDSKLAGTAAAAGAAPAVLLLLRALRPCLTPPPPPAAAAAAAAGVAEEALPAAAAAPPPPPNLPDDTPAFAFALDLATAFTVALADAVAAAAAKAALLLWELPPPALAPPPPLGRLRAEERPASGDPTGDERPCPREAGGREGWVAAAEGCCGGCAAAGGGAASLRVDMSWIRTPGPAGESSSTMPGIVWSILRFPKRSGRGAGRGRVHRDQGPIGTMRGGGWGGGDTGAFSAKNARYSSSRERKWARTSTHPQPKLNQLPQKIRHSVRNIWPNPRT